MVKRLRDELNLLKTIKGQLNTAIRHQFTLMETIGKVELPDDFTRPAGLDYTQIGEVLYENVLMCANVSKRIEDVTNVIRVEAGTSKKDYSNSIANQVIDGFHVQVEESRTELEASKAV